MCAGCRKHAWSVVLRAQGDRSAPPALEVPLLHQLRERSPLKRDERWVRAWLAGHNLERFCRDAKKLLHKIAARVALKRCAGGHDAQLRGIRRKTEPPKQASHDERDFGSLCPLCRNAARRRRA